MDGFNLARCVLVCSVALLPAALAVPSHAQTPPRAAEPVGDLSPLAGQQVRVTTITGAVWPGKLTEITDDRVVVQGSSGAYTISRAAIQSVEPLNAAPRPRPVAATAARPAMEGGEFRIHGSNTMGAQMIPNLIEAYGQAATLKGLQVTPGKVDEERTISMGTADPGRAVTIELHSHGTGTAFTSLATRTADLGMASRPVNDKEREAVMAAGLGDLRAVAQEHVVALDGLAVIVNRDNQVSTLTLPQIAAVFTGAVTNWSDVGGAPGRIQVYTLDVKSGTFDTFNDLVLRRRPMAPGAKQYEAGAKLSDDVAADPNGIGFVGFAYSRSAKPVTVVQSCSLAVPTEAFAVRTEEYPLSRRLFLYNPAEIPAPAMSFLNYVRSAQAQPVVAAAGFINLAPELSNATYSEFRKRSAPEEFANGTPPVDTMQSRSIVQSLRTLFSDAQRLSITFRFQPDSSALDTRSEADIGRLVAWSREPANARRQVVLVGYSSSVGSFAQNVLLSRGRADALAARLQGAGLRVAGTVGAGPLSAVACNADARGQALNRRVEVWAK